MVCCGASLPNSLPDDVRLGNWNWPRWEYLYHRNPQNAINQSSSSPLLGEAVLNIHRLKPTLWVLSWKLSTQQLPPLGEGYLEIREGGRLWSDQALSQDSMGKKGHCRTPHQTTDKADERQALWWEQHEVTTDNLSHFTMRPNCPTYTLTAPEDFIASQPNIGQEPKMFILWLLQNGVSYTYNKHVRRCPICCVYYCIQGYGTAWNMKDL